MESDHDMFLSKMFTWTFLQDGRVQVQDARTRQSGVYEWVLDHTSSTALPHVQGDAVLPEGAWRLIQQQAASGSNGGWFEWEG